MVASGPVWSAIVAVIGGFILIEYPLSVRRGHVPTLREAVVWSAICPGIAIAFDRQSVRLSVHREQFHCAADRLAESAVIRHPVAVGRLHRIHFWRRCADHHLRR
jgi:hypothetical protein